MLGSVVHDPVGASPLRPDRVLRTNRAGVLLDLGPLCVLPEYAVRQTRSALAELTVSSRSAGRVFSLWACPPHIGRAGSRAGHLARPSLCRCYMGLFSDNRFASVCAKRIEFCPWGCFPTKLLAP